MKGEPGVMSRITEGDWQEQYAIKGNPVSDGRLSRFFYSLPERPE